MASRARLPTSAQCSASTRTTSSSCTWLSRRKEHQLRCARALLDERLAVEALMIDQFWLNDVPPQLHWLREPVSLRLLLQRPAWLDEWRRGE